MQFPIIIGLHRSRLLAVALVTIALLAVGITLILPLAATIQWASSLLISAIAYQASKKLEPRFLAIRLEYSGQLCAFKMPEADFLETKLLAKATVHPWLTVVRFRTPDGVLHTLIATADNMKPEDFRRLRAFLRWRAKFGHATDDV